MSSAAHRAQPGAARRALLLASIASCAAACGSDGDGDGDVGVGPTSSGAPGPAWFREVSGEAGLVFEHRSGHEERYYFPEAMTTGAALFDADGDGDLDAYLVQGGSVLVDKQESGNALFLNRGDGTFEDSTAGSGADDRGYGMGAATGDFDGDGDLDLFVTNLGRDTLLRNDGDARFTDVTDEAGVGGSRWSTGAAFVDFDKDGDLDLFVASYVYWSVASDPVCQEGGREPTYCGPRTYEAPTPDTLYRNEGDGTFIDVSRAMGVDGRRGNGLGVLAGDFDDDGVPEIFVANDGSPNHFWRRAADGRLEEAASWLGCAVDNLGVPKAGMGVAAADVDRDGDEDLLVVNLGGENDSFFRNDGGQFLERTAAMGLSLVSRRYTRFGVALVDFDLDGRLDAFHANGRVMHPVDPPATGDPFAEPNAVLRGTEGGRFEPVAAPGDFAPELVATSRAAAFGDIDGDGDVDVLVHNKDGRAHLLRNEAPRGGRWAQLRIVGETGGDALGAALWIDYDGRTVRTEIRTSSSYCAACSPIVQVGLGDVATIERVRVRWPDGAEETFGPLDADRLHTLTRGAEPR